MPAAAAAPPPLPFGTSLLPPLFPCCLPLTWLLLAWLPPVLAALAAVSPPFSPFSSPCPDCTSSKISSKLVRLMRRRLDMAVRSSKARRPPCADASSDCSTDRPDRLSVLKIAAAACADLSAMRRFLACGRRGQGMAKWARR